MILDNSKLTRSENQYMYEIVIPNQPSKFIFFQLTPEEKFAVLKTDSDTAEISNLKEFDLSANGFSEATDYFESLIAKESSSGGNSNGENTAPPIGILEVLIKSSVSIKMFDGRTADLRIGEYTLKSNIFTFQIDYLEFKKDEKYYIDVIGRNPKILGVFPFGDLETEDGSTPSANIDQEDINEISDDKDPFNQNPNPTPNDDGDDDDDNPNPRPRPRPDDDGDDDGDDDDDDNPNPRPRPRPDDDGDDDGDNPNPRPRPRPDDDDDNPNPRPRPDNDGDDDDDNPNYQRAKDIISETYGLKQFGDLVTLFGSREALLDDILLMDEMEMKGIFSKLAQNFTTKAQFENTMTQIILN